MKNHSKPTNNPATGTFRLRLSPRQYPVMKAIVLREATIGVSALEQYNNGPIRALFLRDFITSSGTKDPHLIATPAGEHAFETYHRGVIAKRKVSSDLTEYVRTMLKLKNGRNGK
jgi:hypothetical protein